MNLVLENLSSNSGHESICRNKLQKRDLVSSLPYDQFGFFSHSLIRTTCTHKFVQARMSCESFIPHQNVLWKLHSSPECLMKASFHTRMSCASFIPHRNVLWKLHSTLSFLEPAEITCVVQDTSLSQPECLVLLIPHRYFQNQCRIMYRCGSQNALLVLDSALTVSRTSNILEKKNQ